METRPGQSARVEGEEVNEGGEREGKMEVEDEEATRLWVAQQSK